MKKGFVFIETIIVITILTVGLMSLYANYSKIISNTKEFNTFDTAEYNYKTYFLKQKYANYITVNTCQKYTNVPFSDDASKTVKICKFEDVFDEPDYTAFSNIDAYIIDYINNNDLHENNDDLFLVEYKKEDKQNPGNYLTYISSLNY